MDGEHMRFKLDKASKDQIELMVRTWAKKFDIKGDQPLGIDARSDLDLIIDMISLTSEYAHNMPRVKRNK